MPTSPWVENFREPTPEPVKAKATKRQKLVQTNGGGSRRE